MKGDISKRVSSYSMISDVCSIVDQIYKVPQRIWDRLYRYQQEGVEWLWHLHKCESGGILGDEMGLGKTIQIIAFLAGLKVSCSTRSSSSSLLKFGPILIVCPATLIFQWKSQIEDWAPDMKVFALHRSNSAVNQNDKRQMEEINRQKGIVLCTYSGLLIYSLQLAAVNWQYVILDEGHKIRNPEAKITIRCKSFFTRHKIIVSGSPMQNNLRELWCLFDFVFPGKLGTLDRFMELFAIPIQHGGYANANNFQVQIAFKCATVLKDEIRPLLLRRLKSEHAEINLPTKNEQVLFCKLTDEQTKLYKDYIESDDCLSVMQKDTRILAAVAQLKKICNHPDLYTSSNSSNQSIDGQYKRSGKMRVVHTLLGAWKAAGKKVLLFSQSRKMLDIFEIYLNSQDYSFLRMDGNTFINQRQILIEKFNKDQSIFIFLLTTRVGGLGLNLTGANRVIIYDPDWNPSVDTQARERVWRIGQLQDVTIYRLVCSGSIEEKIFHRQLYKHFLADRVLSNPKKRRFFKINDIHDLFSMDTATSNTDLRGRKNIFRTETEELLHGTNAKCIRSVEQQNKSVVIDGIAVPDIDISGKPEEFIESDSDDKKSTVVNNTDDYIIGKLLETNNVHCAFEHDSIIASDEKDYAFVKIEADMYAKNALKELADSRESYFIQSKFDRERLLPELKNTSSSSHSDANAILDGIRKRKFKSTSNDEVPDISRSRILRDIIAYMKKRNNQATSDQLITNFGSKLPEGTQAKFKSLIRSIANLEDNGLRRMWKLKPLIVEEYDLAKHRGT